MRDVTSYAIPAAHFPKRLLQSKGRANTLLPPGVELTTEALFDEIRSGNVETVRLLIESGLSANRVCNGVTPLEHVLTLID